MKKFVCQVCGYVYEGEAAPEYCPQCKAPASKFVEMKGETLLIAKVILKSACTGKKLLTKKQNMQLNLLNCSVKLLPTAPKRTLKCV